MDCIVGTIGEMRLYNDPVGEQVEIVGGDLMVLVLGQLDELVLLASLAMPSLGVTVSAQVVLLPFEIYARALELRKVHTTHGKTLERFGVALLLGAVAWSLVWLLVQVLVQLL